MALKRKLLLNVYGPNSDDQAAQFYGHVLSVLRKVDSVEHTFLECQPFLNLCEKPIQWFNDWHQTYTCTLQMAY